MTLVVCKRSWRRNGQSCTKCVRMTQLPSCDRCPRRSARLQQYQCACGRVFAFVGSRCVRGVFAGVCWGRCCAKCSRKAPLAGRCTRALWQSFVFAAAAVGAAARILFRRLWQLVGAQLHGATTGPDVCLGKSAIIIMNIIDWTSRIFFIISDVAIIIYKYNRSDVAIIIYKYNRSDVANICYNFGRRYSNL